MSLSTTHGKGVIEIDDIDADWVYGTDVTANEGFPAGGMGVRSIAFVPSQANDRMIIHDGGVDAAVFFDTGAMTTVDPAVQYFERNEPWRRPVIDESDCTIGGSSANSKVIITYY